jgi:cytochrome c-type biogenesis protein
MSLELSELVFAFTAGVLSIFSPCGYALLPGYVSYYMGSELTFRKAIVGGSVCALGLTTVFSLIGVLASSLGVILPQIIPLLDLLAGIIMIALGFVILSQINLPLLQMNLTPTKRTGLIGLYLFGIVYGIAGVGCSAPIFLSVLFFAVSGGWLNGVIALVAYSAGMGLPLIVTSVLLAEAQDVLIRRISGATEKMHKISGGVLIIVGLSLLYAYFQTKSF